MLFSSSAFNGIFRMDLNCGEVWSLGTIPNEKVFGSSLYSETVACGKWLLMVPLAAREIAVLARGTGRCIKKLKLPAGEEHGWKFVGGFVYGTDVILVPGRYPYFVSVCMADFSVSVLQDWREYLRAECMWDNQKILATFTVGRRDPFLYIQVLDTRYLLKFDLEKKRIAKLITLPERSYAFAICDEKNTYVVPGQDGEILCISLGNDKIERFCPMPVCMPENSGEHVCVHGRIVKNRLILFPQKASRLGVVDLDTGRTNEYCGSWSIETNGKKINAFQKINMIGSGACIALVRYEDQTDYGLYRIDLSDFSEKRLKMLLSDKVRDIVKESMQSCIEQNEILDESMLHIFGETFVWDSFIQMLGKQKAEGNSGRGALVGDRIFRFLERQM